MRKYTHGVELLADFTGDSFAVIRATPLANAPRLTARQPRLDDATPARPDEAEITLTVIDKRGASLDRAAYGVRATRYIDWLAPDGRAPAGGPHLIHSSERDLRTIRVPLTKDGWISFHRSEAQPGFARRTQRVPLALYDAGTRPGRDAPRLSDPRLPTFERTVPLPWSRMPHTRQRYSITADAESWPVTRPTDHEGGRIITCEPLETHATGRFNIVITGDGFQQAELPLFDALARRLLKRFRTMRPFTSVWRLMNWYVVRAASRDSGVRKCCTKHDHVETFYQTEGAWKYPGAPPGFVGAPEEGLTRIRQAAEWAVGGEPIGIIIVIVNCCEYGGHGWADRQMAFVTASWRTPRLFVGMVAHEFAHVVGRIGEEYISTPIPGVPIPDDLPLNVATLADVAASVRTRLLSRAPALSNAVQDDPKLSDRVWWRAMAGTHELSAKGCFLAAHVLGDHMDGTKPRLKPSSRDKRLGAFWGAQAVVCDVDEVWQAYCDLLGLSTPAEEVRQQLWRLLRLPATDCAEQSYDVWHEPRGALHFRAMGVCRMRQVTQPFCRVCCHLLSNRIKEVCGAELDEPVAPW